MTGGKKMTKPKAHKASDKRSPSIYNNFMSTEIKRVKTADAAMDHRTAFLCAADNWKTSPLNPKRA